MFLCRTVALIAEGEWVEVQIACKKLFIEIANRLSGKNAWRLLAMVRDSPWVIPKLKRGRRTRGKREIDNGRK